MSTVSEFIVQKAKEEPVFFAVVNVLHSEGLVAPFGTQDAADDRLRVALLNRWGSKEIAQVKPAASAKYGFTYYIRTKGV